jgi:N-acetylglutamate synthase-like GNAT family acetyltransferase
LITGNVYVQPKYRPQGFGSAVNKKSLDEARRIGISELYLYTRDREGFYSRLGWEIVEQVTYRG